MGTTLGTFWYNKGIAIVGANRSGVFMNGVPIVAMFLSVLFLGEEVVPATIIGVILVIAGVFLNSFRNHSSLELKESSHNRNQI